MSEAFDPYHQWLGIQPKDQPPHHYRLLGVELFEQNADVIFNAADQRMSHIRTFQAGKHGDLSQRVLNEIAAAKVCLLSEEKKAAYDTRLREKRAVRQTKAKPPPVAKPLPTARPAGSVRVAFPAKAKSKPEFDFEPSSSATRRTSATQRTGSKTPIAISVAAALVLLLVVIAVGRHFSNAGSEPVATADRPVETEGNPPVGDPQPGGGSAVPEDPGPQETGGLRPDPPAGVGPNGEGLTASPPGEIPPPPGPPDPGPDTTSEPESPEKPADPREMESPPAVPGKPIDLLAMIRLDRDVGHGKWSRRGDGALVGTFDDTDVKWFMARALIDPPAQYDLTIEATRVDGDSAMTVQLVVAGRRCHFSLDGMGGDLAGFSLVKGKTYSENETTRKVRVFVNNKPTTVVCRVRETSVTVLADGKPVLEWEGDPRDLSLEGDSEETNLGLGGWSAKYVFTRFELRPVSGDAVIPDPGGPLAEGPARLPVPERAKQEEQLAAVKEIYGEAFQSARDPQQKAALAKKLYELAGKSQEDPAALYVLLDQSRKFAAEGGDGQLALQVVNALSEKFEVDPWAMKTELLVAASAAARTIAARGAVASQAMKMADEAVADEAYPAAIAMVEVAQRIGQRARQFAFVRDTRRRLATLTREKAQWELAEEARQKLEQDPEDGAANRAYGTYICFVRGEWQRGLPLLIKADDPELKGVLEKEMTPPADANQQVELGQVWWDLGVKAGSDEKAFYAARCCFWYRQAVGRLDGLNKTRIEKFLEKNDPVWSQVTTGLVGHWKLDDGPGAVAVDATGRQNGKYVGTFQWRNVGGRAIPHFNGNDTAVQFTKRNFGNQFTIALWCNPEGKREAPCLFSNTWVREDLSGFRIRVSKSATRLIFLETSGGKNTQRRVMSPEGSVTWGEWVHVAVTLDREAGSGRIYLNGKDASTSTETAAGFDINREYWWIGGARGGYSDNHFRGLMADVRIYDRILSPREIASLAKMEVAMGSGR